MNRSWRLVARPESRTSRPVANGSSVPAWPVFAPVRATDARDDRRTTTAPPACRRGSPRSARAPSGSALRRVCRRLRSTNASRMRRVISSIARSVEKPAARLWPPPPKSRAIAETSTPSGCERSEPFRAAAAPAGSSRTSATSSAPSTARRWSMIPSEYGSSAPAASKSSRRSSETTILPVRQLRRALERAREELELRERRRLVDLDEHLRHVRARLDELGREPQRLRASCSSTGTGPCRSRSRCRAPRRSRA